MIALLLPTEQSSNDFSAESPLGCGLETFLADASSLVVQAVAHALVENVYVCRVSR